MQVVLDTHVLVSVLLFKGRLSRIYEAIEHRELTRFINYYNTVKPHKGIHNRTPLEQLITYFYPKEL